MERHALQVEYTRIVFRKNYSQMSVMFALQTKAYFVSYCVLLVLPLYAVMNFRRVPKAVGLLTESSRSESCAPNTEIYTGFVCKVNGSAFQYLY